MEPRDPEDFLRHLGAEEFQCSICKKRAKSFPGSAPDEELPEGWSYGPEGLPLCDDCTLYFMVMLTEFTF